MPEVMVGKADCDISDTDLMVKRFRDLAKRIWDPVCQTRDVARTDSWPVTRIDCGVLSDNPEHTCSSRWMREVMNV